MKIENQNGGKLRVYIAGPMRGVAAFNYPAFDRARDRLAALGYFVCSPPDLDRQAGLQVTPSDFDAGRLEPSQLWPVVRRSLLNLIDCDAIYLLDGWHNSAGARAELAVAEWLGLQVLRAIDDGNSEPLPQAQPATAEDILEEALRVTRGDRQAQYGPPDQDFTRTALMWSALKGVPFEAREVAMFMVALKLSREVHQRKRDNWVDIAGYARCGSLCRPPAPATESP